MPGLIVSVAIVAVALIVLVVGQVGSMHGNTERVYLATDRAQSLIPGTDVWLDGKPVGKVVWVHFRPPRVDTAYRMLIALDVASDIRRRLRRDTRAQVTAGTSFIGAPVIEFSGGSPSAVQLADGDTLQTAPQRELDEARASLAQAAQNLPQVLENVRAVRTQVVSTTGTIGAFEGEGGTARQFNSLSDLMGRLSTRAKGPHGSLSQLTQGDLTKRANRAMARADSIQHSPAADSARANRERGDSALAHSITETRAELDTVQVLLASVAADSVVYRPGAGAGLARIRHRMAALDAELGRLLSDVVRRPLRYIAF